MFHSQTNYFSGYPAPVMAPPPQQPPTMCGSATFYAGNWALLAKVSNMRNQRWSHQPPHGPISLTLHLPPLLVCFDFQYSEFLRNNYEFFHSEDSCFKWRDKISLPIVFSYYALARLDQHEYPWMNILAQYWGIYLNILINIVNFWENILIHEYQYWKVKKMFLPCLGTSGPVLTHSDDIQMQSDIHKYPQIFTNIHEYPW